jgi:uncharacterized membrane protein
MKCVKEVERRKPMVVLLIIVVVVVVILLLAAAVLGLGWVVSRVFGFAGIEPYQATVVLMFVVGAASYWLGRIGAAIGRVREAAEEEDEEEDEENEESWLPTAGPSSYARRSFRREATPGEPGRNEPCPCGSGKKYRRCCGRRQV